MEGAGLEKSVFAFYMPFIVIYDLRISFLQKILKGYNIALSLVFSIVSFVSENWKPS